MQSSLDNEYTNLLNYLENSLIKKDKKIEVPVKKIIASEIEKKEAVDNTQKILKDCLDLSDFNLFSDGTSKGFDVNKYENLLRVKLIEDHKKYQSYERPYISVLEIVASCIRKVYYERAKYIVDVKKMFTFPYLYPIQKVGDSLHECITDIYDFREINKTVVSEKYKVKGKIDALTEPYVYEIKTLDSDKFTGKYINEHYYQGLVYAYILNLEYGYNMKNVTLIYQFRDKLKQKPIPFDLPMENELAKSLMERSLIIQSSLQTKEVPDCIGATKELCHYCVFRDDYCAKESSKVELPFEKKIEEVKKEKAVFLL